MRHACMSVVAMVFGGVQCYATGPSLLNDNGQQVVDQRPIDNNKPVMPSPFIQRHNVEITWPKIEIPITFTLQHEIQPDNYFIGCFVFIGVAIIIAGYCQIVAANRK